MIRLAIACALSSAARSRHGATTASWRWPVPLDPAVSSNFCEYRDGRFHAGIDVRTFGREGVPCIAVADGWISRMRAGSRGYGKALHLTLDDSTQIVYGHLSEFAPALEDTLLARRCATPPTRSISGCRRVAFACRRGDTIAYSGATGTHGAAPAPRGARRPTTRRSIRSERPRHFRPAAPPGHAAWCSCRSRRRRASTGVPAAGAKPPPPGHRALRDRRHAAHPRGRWAWQ